MYQLHIPTHTANTHQDNAYEHANTLHYTTWKDDTTHMWTRQPDGKWNIPDKTDHEVAPSHITPHIPPVRTTTVTQSAINLA